MSASRAAIILIGLLLQNVMLIVVAAWALRRRGLTLRDVGLNRLTCVHFAWGVGLGLAAALASYGIGGLELWAGRHLLAAGTFHALQSASDNRGAEHTFRQLRSAWAAGFYILIGTLLAPVGEEVFFRGWLYNALKRRFAGRGGAGGAMAGSALLFAALHGSPLNLLPIFLLGLLFAWSYERTGSLWVPILLHAVNNAVAFTILIVSGSR